MTKKSCFSIVTGMLGLVLLIAICFNEVSGGPGKRCRPYEEAIYANKKAKQEHEAATLYIPDQLRAHAERRIYDYFELLMLSNMCHYPGGFENTFKFAASHQEAEGSRAPGKLDIKDYYSYELATKSVGEFSKIDAAHVSGFGLKDEPATYKCDLRSLLEKTISRTTHQLQEVNVNVDKAVDKAQFEWGKIAHAKNGMIFRNHIYAYLSYLKLELGNYRYKIHTSAVEYKKKTRLEFYANIYLEVISDFSGMSGDFARGWSKVCNRLDESLSNFVDIARCKTAMSGGTPVRENVLQLPC